VPEDRPAQFVVGYSHLNEQQIEEITERLARAWRELYRDD
jgi:DNA-binding transcriptional MocR family regulator